eukprot:TRINITY_DN17501_c0_g1_i1.p1 TRINITY_DN17501_c0_g1~~TRINITY_DN17501_c0_g1_i1.p1  ORF type:complete len:362 (+),score=51.82 TRINITY_DN17501_c0_g1_i1:71-1156(+)
MSTLWGEVDDLPPPCSSDAGKPEEFEGLPKPVKKKGASGLVQNFMESTALVPGAVVKVNKTGESGIALEVFSTYVKLTNGEAHSRHGVKVLCGNLLRPFEPSQFKKDLVIAEEVIRKLRTDAGHVVIDNLLDKRDRIACSKQAWELTMCDEMYTAGTGTGTAHKRDGRLRGDTMMWLPKDGSLPPSMQYVVDKVNRLRRALSYLLKVPLTKHSVQLCRYPGEGVGYVKHRDVKLNAPEENKRRLTCVYYCNEDWEESHGGCLELYPASRMSQYVERKSDAQEVLKNKQVKKHALPVPVRPSSGTLAIFHSSMLHSVLPDYKARVAMTIWMSGPESLGMKHSSSDCDIDAAYAGDESIYPSR